ncbi:MAG: GTPase HflX [Chlamydiae bacterium]|nr:GTPase HflX [Chlamydiota bacterium]
MNKTAFLITVYQDQREKEHALEYLRELNELAKTYGFTVVGEYVYMIRKFDAGSYLGEGKIEELSQRATELGAEIIVFDDEITPNQQKNLEKGFKRPVMDRTELILEIFAEHAQTKEAKLQIELAQVRYQLPRLKRMWTHLSRQRMSGGHLKGEGEKQIEIDRRILKRRIQMLEREIDEVKLQRETKRRARLRSKVPSFAIIGYTNAGKSTLLNALTDAEVLVEDKLFATLDTTSRQFLLPNNQKIVLIDTVGFIRKLPHALVAAFRSTLEEVAHTDILLHLIDVSHPYAFEHAEATYEVLKELKIDENKPIITVLNKIDLCEDREKLTKFRIRYPKTVRISALTKEGFDDLYQEIENAIKELRKPLRLKIPQSQYALISELLRLGNVLSTEYEDNDVVMEIEVPTELEYKVKDYIV